jgi:hypothetical protein
MNRSMTNSRLCIIQLELQVLLPDIYLGLVSFVVMDTVAIRYRPHSRFPGCCLATTLHKREHKNRPSWRLVHNYTH